MWIIEDLPLLKRYRLGNYSVYGFEINLIGRHQGLMYHTIGQRQGLGIGGLKNAGEAPWYVTEKDVVTNTLWVCQHNDNPALFASSLTTSDIFWINGQAPSEPLSCHAKVRYRQADQACTVSRSADRYEVDFEQPQRAKHAQRPQRLHVACLHACTRVR